MDEKTSVVQESSGTTDAELLPPPSDHDNTPYKEGHTLPLKTTRSGIPLVPQPSDDPDDPLNWSVVKKHAALIVLGIESALVKFCATLIAPGAHHLARQFGTPASTATYIGSAPSILYSLAPFLWIPLSRRIGRRPVLLIGHVSAMVAAVGVARSQTYAQALGCRMLMGFGGSVGLCISPAAISDMFYLHEKGKRMGVNAFFLVIAPYAGGIAGGAIQQNKRLGWRWSMYVAAILYAAQFFNQIFLVPETIYERDLSKPYVPQKKSLYQRLGFRTPQHPDGETWRQSFSYPYMMFAYPAVVLPCFWASVCVMTQVANTAGFPLNFGEGSRWHFNTAQVGLCSFSGLIGAALGECCAGPLCDMISKRALKRGDPWVPEKLLRLLFTSVFMCSLGLLLYGLLLDYANHWVGPLSGIAIFCFGQEIIVTVLLTYMTDCYPGRAGEVAIVFQFCFHIQCFHPPFYVPQWIAKPAGAKVPYIVFSLFPIIFWPFCIGSLLWKGQQIRNKGALFRISSF